MSPQTAIAKSARLWDGYLSFIAARDKVSINKAIDVALREEVGRELFALAKQATAFDKLGDGGFQPRTFQQSGDEDPRGTVSNAPHESGDQALARLRSEHQQKATRRFTDHAEALRQRRPGMSRSESLDLAARERPDLWAEARGRTGAGTDERSLRPPRYGT
jgi:hypothetical protein